MTRPTKTFTLEPDPQNANRGTARGRKMLADSLAAYGAGRSIVTDRDGRILAGNQTAAAAEAAGLPLKVIESDGSTLVVVRRTDLDAERDAAARELAIADNRVAEVGLEWDTGRLAAAMTPAGEDALAPATDEALDAFWTPAEQARIRGETPPPTERPTAATRRVPTEVVLRFDAAQAERWRLWMRALERRYPDRTTIAERIDAALADWAPDEK